MRPILGFAEAPDYGPAPPEHDAGRVYDVCVIGSGAAGSVAARELVAAGLDVVMLEQGPFVTERTSFADLVKEAEPAYVRLYGSHWAAQGNPWTSCNVGGGTVWYGAASFRYREVDFRAARHFPEADLPLDWPYDYAEIEPYYDEIEDVLGVAASPERDPTAPPGRNARNLPPVEPSRAGRVITEAARTLGLRAFPTPLAIATVPHRGRSACESASPCINQRCERGAKGDAVTTMLGPMLRGDGRFTLYAGLRAARLERDTRAVVSRVVALRVDTGRAYTLRARRFVVACSAVESAS
ncbi:MAG: FAD-dependent oxidoreductase, partial [Deltaproteobacteria bacterium]